MTTSGSREYLGVDESHLAQPASAVLLLSETHGGEITDTEKCGLHRREDGTCRPGRPEHLELEVRYQQPLLAVG